MTILITGGSGFLGSHLCTRFYNEGWKVLCLDNFLTGVRSNIQHLIGKDRFQLIEHDIIESIKIKQDIDVILHFASPASPMDYLELPIQTLQVGSMGAQNVLELAKEKSAIFLLASTSEVYGDPLEHPQKESYYGNVNPIGPRGVYDEAKRYAEALTMAYYNYGIDTRIVRIFNTYGSNMRLFDGRAVPTFFWKALTNQPIPIFGNGTQTRSFTYVDDLVEGIYRLLSVNYCEPINLGNPEEISIHELAKEIIQLTESRSKIEFQELPENDPKVRCPDISKANGILNWYPKTDRKVGLSKTMVYFKSIIDQL